MAKNVAKQSKAPVAPAAPAPRTRGRAFPEQARITVVKGEGERRVVQNLSCHRALQAMVDAKGNARTVKQFIDAFAPMVDAKAGGKPLPGRGSQPGTVQAAAILRYLEMEGAVTVASK
jgi:hypothetical protein